MVCIEVTVSSRHQRVDEIITSWYYIPIDPLHVQLAQDHCELRSVKLIFLHITLITASNADNLTNRYKCKQINHSSPAIHFRYSL